MSSNKRALALLAAAIVLAGAGWWTYGEYRQRESNRALVAAVQDTTARLRDSLAVAPNVTSKGALARLDEHADAVDAHLKTIREARNHAELADGAEHYLIGAREILRREAAAIRQSEQSAASRASLVSHMRRAARRDGAWIREAMLQKKIVESHYFDYNVTLGALAELLKDFPETSARLAPHLDATALLPRAPVEEARTLVLKESKRAAEELDSVRRLAPR